MTRGLLVWLFGAFSLVIANTAAQGQAPEIQSLLGCGAQRGTTAVIRAEGRFFAGAKALISGQGVSAETVAPAPPHTAIEIRLRVDTRAPLGVRELRLFTSQGASNPVRIWIDSFPEVLEKEPNDHVADAQPLPASPSVINGRIQNAADQDRFVFTAQAGETWVFDLNAARLRSRLDPVLELQDSAGKPLALAQSLWENDPRLIYRFAHSGTYRLTLHDTQYLGGGDFYYRLTTGKLPVVTGFSPRGGALGQNLELRVSGVNLEGVTQAKIAIPQTASLGEAWEALETPMGVSLPIALQTTSLPLDWVQDETKLATLRAIPGAYDGTFLQKAAHRFLLRAKAGEAFSLDLLGRRIGSRIDGALRILDSAGKEVAANDDALEKEARLEFRPSATGDYVVEVRNVEEKTGGDCFYRLITKPLEPDFEIRPASDRVHVGAGGAVSLLLNVIRQNYNGGIRIYAKDLPAWVSCAGGVIAEGLGAMEITFAALPNAPQEAIPLHLFAEAQIGGKRVVKEIFAQIQRTPRSIDPGMFTDDSYRAPYYRWETLPIAATPRNEPFALEASAADLKIPPGGSVEWTVTAKRNAGAEGEILLELRHLPPQVTAQISPIPAKQNQARIVLKAAPNAPVTIRNVIVQGKLGAAIQVAPAISLSVRP